MSSVKREPCTPLPTIEALQEDNNYLHSQIRKVSCGIRNSLNGIISVSELLRTTVINHEQQELIECLEKAVEGLLAAVGSLNNESSNLGPTLLPERSVFIGGLKPQKNKHVLLVDDNETNLMFTTLLLQRRGYLVDSATTGRQAIQKIDEVDYDVVILDLQMPDMSGFEALQEIRKLDKSTGKHTKVISFSAYTQDVCTSGVWGQFDGNLPKPISIDQLINEIKRLVNSRP